jgi:hypothetical protein
MPPPDAPLDAPLDEPDVPPEVPADAPFPDVPDPVVPPPVVPAPVVPPPVSLPLSLPPPAPGAVDGRVPRVGGTDDRPEFVLLGLLLRTQSARAVPVRPAHDALGASVELIPLDVDDEVLGVDDVVLGVDDVPYVDDCANAAPAATNDAARTSVFNFRNVIEPPEERKNYKDRKRS